jgi:hypothetical protein
MGSDRHMQDRANAKALWKHQKRFLSKATSSKPLIHKGFNPGRRIPPNWVDSAPHSGDYISTRVLMGTIKAEPVPDPCSYLRLQLLALGLQ